MERIHLSAVDEQMEILNKDLFDKVRVTDRKRWQDARVDAVDFAVLSLVIQFILKGVGDGTLEEVTERKDGSRAMDALV